MSTNHTEAEAKLKKLADRLHQGWAKLHPATEKDLAAVRAVVLEQWEQEQRASHGPATEKKNEQTQQNRPRTQSKSSQQKKTGQSQKPQGPSQDQGHGHSH